MQPHRIRANSNKQYFRPASRLTPPLEKTNWLVIGKLDENSPNWFLAAKRRSPSMTDVGVGYMDDYAVERFVQYIDEYMDDAAWIKVIRGSGKANLMNVMFSDYFSIGNRNFAMRDRMAMPPNAVEIKNKWGYSGPSCGMCYKVFDDKETMLSSLTEEISDMVEPKMVIFAQEPNTIPEYSIMKPLDEVLASFNV